jgi:radical SAM protein with 4Fe4S-binding SPASM domain
MAGKKNTVRTNELEEHLIEDESYQVIDGVASVDKPAVQLFVNKRLIRALGIDENDATSDEERYLPAIEEAIYSVIEQTSGNSECIDFERIIDKLVVMGVNRITFKGDNLFAWPGIIENARYAHDRGIMPSMITSIRFADKGVLRNAGIFARININLHNTTGDCSGNKDEEYLDMIIDAINEIKNSNTEIIFSMVISSENFNSIGDICKFAARANVKKISLQRIKEPVQGDFNLQPDHLKVLVPVTQRLTKRYGIDFEFDCSLFQALAFHNISVKDAVLEWNSCGCGAGKSFINVEANGAYKGCGSCNNAAGSILDFDSNRHINEQINSFKKWMKNPAAPCEFCSYLDLCRGGCRVVAKHSTGDFNNPDPACPIIADFKRGIIHVALTSGKDEDKIA